MEGSTDCVVGVDSDANVKPSCGCSFNVIARISFDFQEYIRPCHVFKQRPLMAYNFLSC